MAPKKNTNELLAEIQDATRKAVEAEVAAADEAPPDHIEINGVTYYRTAPAAAPTAIDPDPEIESVVIDLAPHAKEVMINGVKYMNGYVYKVSRDLARVLRDIAYKTWQHEKQTGGAFMNMPSARNVHMSALGGGRNLGAIGAPGVSGI